MDVAKCGYQQFSRVQCHTCLHQSDNYFLDAAVRDIRWVFVDLQSLRLPWQMHWSHCQRFELERVHTGKSIM